MILEAKIVATLGAVTFILLAEQSLLGLPNAVRIILDIAALTILASGFLVLGRLKAALGAAEAASEAWKLERDAAVAKSERLQQEKEAETKAYLGQISDLQVQITKLEQRPSLEEVTTKLEALIQQVNELHRIIQKERVTND